MQAALRSARPKAPRSVLPAKWGQASVCMASMVASMRVMALAGMGMARVEFLVKPVA